MNVTGINRKDLDQALKACRTLLLFQATDTPLLVEATDSGLMLSATGGGASVRTFIPCEVEQEGPTVIDLNHLLSLHLKGKNTSMKSSKKQIQIRSGRGLFKVAASTGNPKEVSLPTPSKKAVEIQSALLRAAIKAVWFKHDDSGTGDIRIVFGKGGLRTETADELRGVLYKQKMDNWKDAPLSKAILPKKSADAILSAFDPNDTLYLEVTSSTFRMYNDEHYVAIPLVTDSDLPNVAVTLKDQMTELKKVASFTVEADDLSKTTMGATSVLDKKDAEKMASARTVIRVKDSHLTLKTDGDIGSFQTQVPYSDHQGKELEFTVLAKNLADLVAIAKNTGESLLMEVWGSALVMIRNVSGKYKSVYAFPQITE